MYSDFSELANSSSSAEASAILGVLGALGGLLFFFVILLIAIIAFRIIVRWKVFKKAGKEGWEAIIPYYNEWVAFEISGYPGWLGLISLASLVVSWIPGASFLVSVALIALQIIAGLSLAKKFNKSEAFGVILLGIFPLIGYAILAFGSDEYDPTQGNQLNKPAEASSKVFCSNCGKAVPKDTKFCPSCGKEI